MSDDTLILQAFYGLCDAAPDRTYLTQPMGGGPIDHFSRARVLDEASRMASYLKGLGFAPGSQIAIISKNCAHFIIADLAIWMAGHTSVALYPTLPADTVRYILEHSEAKAVFIGKLDGWAAMKPGLPEGLPSIAFPLAPAGEGDIAWEAVLADHAPLSPRPTRAPDERALIIYTSGSTGQPKGVVHDFRSISAAAWGLLDIIKIGPDDRVLSYLPLAHAMERWAVECTSLVVGGHIFFAESLDTFVEDLKRARPTLFLSVPRLWLKFQMGVFRKLPPKKLKRLLSIPVVRGIIRRKVLANLGLDAVRYAASGSAPIPADLIQWYRDLGLELLEGYGMSENFCYSHVSFPGRSRVGYVGNAYPKVQHRISEAGEILVKSPANMTGYFKEPELTAEAFTEDGFLKTGDRGELDSEGRLRITGRVKEIFKTSKGKYVAPAPVENLLNVDPNLELSVVTGAGLPQPLALVQVGEDIHPTLGDPAVRARLTAELTARLKTVNAEVAKFEQLQCLVVVPERWTIEDGFLTPTMKIRRGTVEDTYAERFEAWSTAGQAVVFAE